MVLVIGSTFAAGKGVVDGEELTRLNCWMVLVGDAVPFVCRIPLNWEEQCHVSLGTSLLINSVKENDNESKKGAPLYKTRCACPCAICATTAF